jgi:hypothetical protein
MKSIDRTLEHSNDNILVKNYASHDFLGYGSPLKPSYALIGSPESISNSVQPLTKNDGLSQWTQTHKLSYPVFRNSPKKTLNIFLKSASPCKPDDSRFTPEPQNSNAMGRFTPEPQNSTAMGKKFQSNNAFYMNNSVTPRNHFHEVVRISSNTQSQPANADRKSVNFGKIHRNVTEGEFPRVKKVPLVAKLENLNLPRINVAGLHDAIQSMYNSNRMDPLTKSCGPVYQDELGMKWKSYTLYEGPEVGWKSRQQSEFP